ncbi:MAG: hypothetical protein COY40_00925 [Alphaproteobacteria bacterium CG_4_10_14_0_8_um_filter_53_9]|nr:MAG: hypothetical protein COY40_00925 [Alphaproteobacteria bacterium CG_4_10_14_0_8_um_filter_53_9]
MAQDQILDIVNENDEIIGQALRSKIHAEGLLHREVHVFFLTPNKKIILQKRAEAKDWGGYLDATAGGHVEPGQTYLQAALMEVEEETGFILEAEDITHLSTLSINHKAPDKPSQNNVFRSIFLYRFGGEIEDLKIEEHDGAGFSCVPLSTLKSLTPEDGSSHKIVPNLLNEDYQKLYENM